MLVGSLINGQINYVDPKFLIQPQRALNNFSLTIKIESKNIESLPYSVSQNTMSF